VPDYAEVAQIPVGRLLEPTDQPVTVGLDETLQRAAERVGTTPARTVLVVDGDRLVGLLSQADIAEAVSQGKAPETPVSELMATRPTPITVPEEVSIERVADLVGPVPTVVVVDPEGKPKAVIRRDALAERLRGLFLPRLDIRQSKF
jgi:predicted transcriptional regulator